MKNADLRNGKISVQLIQLALPLLLGNILQQFYNTTDSLIIGHYLGTNAFASTGISGSVMNLFVFVINGFCVGLSVLFAQNYGTGNKAGFRRDFFLSFATGLVITLLISSVALLCMRTILDRLHTPEALVIYCRQYLTIILFGLSATFLYNIFSSVLRSVGNTLAALIVLSMSIILNIILDFILVGPLRLGIAGAAGATVVSQLLSAIFCCMYMQKKYPDLMFSAKDMTFSMDTVVRALRFGLVSALHQSSLYIGKILVQGAVNTLGTDGIAAYTATMRIEGVVNSFGDSGSQSMSIFISQNYGAREHKRVQRGFRTGMRLLVILCILISAVMFVTSNICLSLFLDQSSANALREGNSYIKIISFFYLFCFIGNAFVGYFRGIGKVVIPFVGTTLHLTLRVILSWLLVSKYGLSAIAIATGAGWVLVCIVHTCLYHRINRLY